MDKEKATNHPGNLLPPAGRYSVYSPPGSSYGLRPEPLGSPAFPPLGSAGSQESAHFGHGLSSGSRQFSHDVSRMPDNPPKNVGHRRAHSEILTLPDDLSFDSDLGVVGGLNMPSFSDDTEEDFMSMYFDVDKFSSTSATSAFQVGDSSSTGPSSASIAGAGDSLSGVSEKPRVRHQHSQSMDGSTSIKTEMLTSGAEETSSAEAKKAMSAAKLAELALIDPKRAKSLKDSSRGESYSLSSTLSHSSRSCQRREATVKLLDDHFCRLFKQTFINWIWANRQSAARSKERKMRYIAELERKVQTLQTEATSLSAQLTLMQRDTNGLTAENGELKLRLQTIEQQVHLQDALNDALKEEIQHLKVLTGQIPNGGHVMNYPPSFGTNQQYYSGNPALQTMLTTQQFQQLQIHSQKQQQQQQQQQHQFQHQLQFQPQNQHQQSQSQSQEQIMGDLKLRGSIQSHAENDSPDKASSSKG